MQLWGSQQLAGEGGWCPSDAALSACLSHPCSALEPSETLHVQSSFSASVVAEVLQPRRSGWINDDPPPPPWSTAEHPPYSRSRSASCLSSEVDEGHSKLIAYAAPATPHTRSNPRSVYFHGLKQWSPTFLRPLTSPWWKARSTYWSLERKRQPKLYFQLDAFYFG